MKITDIVEQKRIKDRFSIYLDGKYSFALSVDDLFKSELKVGSTVDDKDKAKFLKLSADSLLTTRTYEKCLRRPHSEKEIRDYLRTKKAEPDLIDQIISKCYKNHLLNDEDFAIRWVEHRRRSGKSNRYISNELRSKGVDQKLIESALQGDDNDQLKRMIAKKSSRYSDEDKLIAYLQRQGFGYSDIRAALTDEAD